MSTIQQTLGPETEVLGAMLLGGLAVSDALAALRPGDFADVRHQVIFDAMRALDAEHHAINLETVVDELRRRGSLEMVPVSYIGGLHSATGGDVAEYIGLVKEAAARRGLAEISAKILTAVDENARPDRIIKAAERRLAELATSGVAEPEAVGNLIAPSLLSAEKAQELGRLPGGVLTGLPSLDYATGGLMPGAMILAAGRPGMGKTALGLNVASSAAAGGAKVLFFSLEMGREEIMRRLLTAESRFPGSMLRGERKIGDKEWPLLVQAGEAIHAMKLWIDDSPALSPLDVRARVRRHRIKHGCDLVVIDYAGLMSADDRYENTQARTAAISGALKALAKELQVPILALQQLNRLLEARGDKRPQLSDLRDTGAWEQDADIVLLIHRPYYYDSEAPERLAEVHVAKHRDGPTVRFKLAWGAEIRRFDEPTAIEAQQWKETW